MEQNQTKHFCYFSIGSILYAILFTFCLFRNLSGITYPFFVGGTLFYFFLSLKRLEISAKKDSIFYVTALMLLSISTFFTDDSSIHILNTVGIFILFFILMLHNFYNDKEWNLAKYVKTVFLTLFGSLANIGSPIADFLLYLHIKKEKDDNSSSKTKLVIYGLLISVPFLIFILFLLGSADIVFASMLEGLLKNIRIPENLIGIFFTMLFAFFASYCIITFLAKKIIKEEVTDERTGEPILAITVTSLLSVIYVIFSCIQIIYLFMGNMILPDGYSYAGYARQGFFQLLFVCLINLSLVLICLSRFKENKVLKTILTLISVCTYIMIASSALRMIMYIKYYYLTFLRIFVLWSLFVIFLLMTGVLISIYKDRFPLFKYSIAVVTVLYITFSFSRPDYWIAKCNTAYMFTGTESSFFESEDRYSDVYYLRNLSADAAPVLLNRTVVDSYNSKPSDHFTASWSTFYIYKITEKAENSNIRNFNVSRHYSKVLLEKYVH